jgi:hypothetical protein
MSEPSTLTRSARRRTRRLPARLRGPCPWRACALGARCPSNARCDVWPPGRPCGRLLAPSDAGRVGICAVEVRA